MESNPALEPDNNKPPFILILQNTIKRRWQSVLDAAVPHIVGRWVFLLLLVGFYLLRVYLVQGFYIVTYGLGIFVLNLFIGFLTPLEDVDADGPMLPMDIKDEFKPFERRLPEYKFWYSVCKAFTIGFVMTFFQVFNIPVFWPILLIYFIVLFVLTMKRQIKHMIKHKYVPFSFGKKKYANKTTSIAEDIRSR